MKNSPVVGMASPSRRQESFDEYPIKLYFSEERANYPNLWVLDYKGDNDLQGTWKSNNGKRNETRRILPRTSNGRMGRRGWRARSRQRASNFPVSKICSGGRSRSAARRSAATSNALGRKFR